MKTEEIAKRLVTLCREGKFEDAQRELYADNAVSTEPQATPAFQKETRGRAAIIEKGKKFAGMIEKVHTREVSDPIVAGNVFACTLKMDVTMKEQGRQNLQELCVYEAKDGKVVSEHFHM